MRKLKFKAWHIYENKMYDVISFCDEFVKVQVGVIVEKVNRLNFAPLMQYTGIKDKNGVEIYEGDIFPDVLNTDLKGVVKHGKYTHCFDQKEVHDFGYHSGFYVDFTKKSIRKDIGYWAKNSTVVGNIHETPELIKDHAD